MEYRYKPGDKVRTIAHFERDKMYLMHSGPDAGNDVGRYTVEETTSSMTWSDEMFVGLANKSFVCNQLL